MNKKELYESIMKNVAKNIKNALQENWDYNEAFGPGSYSPRKNIMGINTDLEMITWWTEEDLDEWDDDFDMAFEDIEEIKNLRPGKSYVANDGINIYVKLK